MIADISIPFAKTLKPSMEEFVNFEQFVENCDKDKSLQACGCFKVIPPKGWQARKNPVEQEFDHLVVHSPIEQNVQGHFGVYELLLIQKKSMKVREYKKKVEHFDNMSKDKSVEEVEEMFWKSIGFSPPLYGADVPGQSLFDKGVPWNLAKLPGVLEEGLKVPLSGINNPYLYVGAWKTMFGWHKEDLDLNSINYNHYGKPKFWYCIPTSENKKLEDFAREHFGEGFAKCKDYLRHKTTMINPYLLKQKIPDLKIHKIIQYPGEFVITFAGAYHAGFNWGFNIAEAVNFATLKWLEILPTVTRCTCIKDSVKIDKKEFFKTLLASPIYGKMPYVRKICAENGVTKEDIEELEAEEGNTEETMDSENRSHSKMRKKSIEERDMALEESKSPSPKLKKNNTGKKPNTRRSSNNKPNKEGEENENKEEDENSEEGSQVPRLSSRTKKIKKIDDDPGSEPKRQKGSNEKSKKNSTQKLQKEAKSEELIFENWVQCDDCNKWRLVRTDNEEDANKLLKKKKITCSNIPGRSCDESEDEEPPEALIISKGKKH